MFKNLSFSRVGSEVVLEPEADSDHSGIRSQHETAQIGTVLSAVK
jgi:hypothetical protein